LRLEREPIRGPIADINGTRVNARAVEFIAKPGRSEELRDHLCKAVTPLLRERSEFIRTIVLTSDEEPRRVVAITFWSLEEHTCAPWEESPLVREILSPLVDVWPRVRTYKAELTETTETDEQAM
jgi:hypothetical protein